MGSSWALFAMVGEKMANTFTDWLYFYVVVSSTVGFGGNPPEKPGCSKVEFSVS